MANKRVSLVRKCKTPEGWKRYPVVMSANGRVKTDTVLVAGVEATFPVGHYELASYSGSKRVWTKVDGNATDALAALKTAQKTANAVAVADDAGVQRVIDPKRTALRDAHPRFVKAAEARGSNEAAEIYDRTLRDFLAGCKKTYAEELTHDDVLKFHADMRKRGLSDRTVSNRHMNLRAFLLSLGFEAEQLKKIAGGKAPKFEKTMPEIFEKDSLKPFFASLKSDYDRLLFDVLLTTGLREREAMHLEFVDLNHSRKTLQVRSKPRYMHKIKDAEEREMPLTVNLIKQLKDYREKHPNARLVFGKRGGEVDEPNGHLLRRLKALARAAGLNCGICETCVHGKVPGKECERWFLHKFRATYITMLLRSGLDLRTVMKLSGHAEGAEVQDRVNSITWR
jgi:integrase